MIYRTFLAAVAVFWLVMTTLLVRSEFFPESARWTQIPVEHVVRTFFRHGQTSELNLALDRQPCGHLRIIPSIDEMTRERRLELSGLGLFQLPGGAKQRLTWRSRLDWESEDKLRSIAAWFTVAGLSEQPTHIWLDLVTAEGNVSFSPAPNAPAQTYHFPLTETGLHDLARHLGMDLTLLDKLKKQTAPTTPSPATITARLATFSTRGERIQSYQITAEYNGQTLLDAHISELGQVLFAKFLSGHTLTPADAVP